MELYLIRMYRGNGEMVEYTTKFADDETAVWNAQKSFNKTFTLLENESPKVLEEIIDEQ